MVTPVHEAPGQLELVRVFVNTLEVETGADELAGAGALASWLRERGLLAGGRVGPGDVEAARGVREALRSLLLANNGVGEREQAALTLTRAARAAALELRFEPEGEVRLEPAAPGSAGALGRLLAIAAGAMADGTWERLKACRADDCRWAFYDHARNRSRQWCSMATCGNRTKARVYRDRHPR